MPTALLLLIVLFGTVSTNLNGRQRESDFGGEYIGDPAVSGSWGIRLLIELVNMSSEIN